jgi:hypothetical protein
MVCKEKEVIGFVDIISIGRCHAFSIEVIEFEYAATASESLL